MAELRFGRRATCVERLEILGGDAVPGVSAQRPLEACAGTVAIFGLRERNAEVRPGIGVLGVGANGTTKLLNGLGNSASLQQEGSVVGMNPGIPRCFGESGLKESFGARILVSRRHAHREVVEVVGDEVTPPNADGVSRGPCAPHRNVVRLFEINEWSNSLPS